MFNANIIVTTYHPQHRWDTICYLLTCVFSVSVENLRSLGGDDRFQATHQLTARLVYRSDRAVRPTESVMIPDQGCFAFLLSNAILIVRDTTNPNHLLLKVRNGSDNLFYDELASTLYLFHRGRPTTIQAISTRTWNCSSELQFSHPINPSMITFHRDNREFLITTNSNIVHGHSLTTGLLSTSFAHPSELVGPAKRPDSGVVCSRLLIDSRHGRLFGIGWEWHDKRPRNRIIEWELKSKELLGTYELPGSGYFQDVVPSPNHDRLLFLDYNTAGLYDQSKHCWEPINAPLVEKYSAGLFLAHGKQVLLIEENGNGTVYETYSRQICGRITLPKDLDFAHPSRFQDCFFGITSTGNVYRFSFRVCS